MLAVRDLHEIPGVLSGYAALIMSTHPEYWSTEMYDALEKYLGEEGNLVYLGGNGIYWRVTIDGREIEVR